MPDRDGAAVDVGPLEVGARLTGPGEHDGRERLVDLEQVDVLQVQAGLLEHGRGARDRALERRISRRISAMSRRSSASSFSRSRKRRSDPGDAARKTLQEQKFAPEELHVSGRELCEGARRLALEHYGLMALTVLNLWGIRSTSDLGEIVFNLIASGDLEKTPNDSRSDFDRVFDFETALRRDYILALDEVA